jgi:hypothetical protein
MHDGRVMVVLHMITQCIESIPPPHPFRRTNQVNEIRFLCVPPMPADIRAPYATMIVIDT